jgi:5-methylcytosine-specific restriction endonuclease McrA
MCADPTSGSRYCYRCKEIRPLSEFIERVDDRFYRMCRLCVSEIQAHAAKNKRRLAHTETHRECYVCRRVQANAAFTRRSNGTFFSACKECNRHHFGQRRRARLIGADGEYSTSEWQALVDGFSRCPACERRWADIPLPPGRRSPITVDHKVPISKGGRNSIENLQPLCYSCNSRKGNR